MKDDNKMGTLLSKSIQLRRFHVAILIVVISICGWALTNYITIMRVTFERVVFTTSISNIQTMLTVNNILKKVSDPQCHFLDDPNFFTEKLSILPIFNFSDITQKSQSKYWQYDNNQHRLIFNMEPTEYFQSSVGPRIILDLKCEKGNVRIKISPHRWCQKMSIWGCSSY